MTTEQYEKKLDGYLNAILASAHSDFSDWFIDEPEKGESYSLSIVAEFGDKKMTIYPDGNFVLEDEFETVISDSSHAEKCQKIYNTVTSRIYRMRIEKLNAFVKDMTNSVCEGEDRIRKEVQACTQK